MKIGLLLTVYNCEGYIKDCLDPWFELKENHDIVIAANSGMFSDYYTLGIPFRNDETLKILSEYDIDFLITTKGKNLLGEDESRNLCLNFLNKQNCDLIWIIDGDECYTKEQIVNIINFINNNPSNDWYSVNFKNLTLEEYLFQDYLHERIIRTDRHGGINSFYFDNEFTYNNGLPLKSANGIEIPKNVAYITHYSWLSKDIRSRDKITYQRWRYCGHDGSLPVELRCSYKWNEENNKLEFSKEFYSGRGLDIPCLHERLSEFSYDFTLNFTRFDNSFKITKVQKDMNLVFEIYHGEDDFLIYKTFLNLSKDINYFIAPSYKPDDDFGSFLIKVYNNDVLIHEEKIYLNVKYRSTNHISTVNDNVTNQNNVNLIITSAHMEDSKRIDDYILSFDSIRKFKDMFNTITIIETLSKNKIEYLENSGFSVYYSELHNEHDNKGVNQIRHVENFIKKNANDNDIYVMISGRYLLQSDNSIKKIIDDYMINDNYEFIAKNAGDIYNGLYDGISAHTFLLFFKKDKFVEFVEFVERNESGKGSIELDTSDFLKISEKCKTLPKEYYMGIKTNYYHELDQYIV